MMEKERGKKKRSELGTLKPTPRHEALIHNLCLPSSYAEQYESKGISFMNPFFAQIYFPHVTQKDSFYLVHRQGFTYELWGGKLGLPTGSYPRLILLDLFRRSVIQKSRVINLGSTVKEYLTSLGLGYNGRIATEVHLTLMQMMQTGITLTQSKNEKQTFNLNAATGVCVAERENFVFIENLDVWRVGEQKPLYWTRTISLSPRFYEYIQVQSKMPFDFRLFTLLAKTKNTLAFDLLLWLPYRVNLLNMNSAPMATITIQQLHDQFDPYSPAPLYKFKDRLRKSLQLVCAIVPGLSDLLSFSNDGRSLLVKNKPLKFLK
jgi:hypothetical protein